MFYKVWATKQIFLNREQIKRWKDYLFILLNVVYHNGKVIKERGLKFNN